MKKLFFVFLIAVLLSPLSVKAKDVGKEDGNDWRTWPEFIKLGYVYGFIVGSNYVVMENLLLLDVPTDFDKRNTSDVYSFSFLGKEKDSFSREEVSLLIAHLQKKLCDYEMVTVTANQLKDGLNLLYKDSKNRSILLTDAIYVVKRQPKGSSPEEIEALLQYFRADSAGMERLKKRLEYLLKTGKSLPIPEEY